MASLWEYVITAPNIASLFILIGSVISLFMGLEQLTGRFGRLRYNIIFFIICMLMTVLQYNYIIFGNGILLKYPGSIFICLTAVYLIGPLSYLYYNLLMYPGGNIKRKHIVHLIPSLAIFSTEIYFQRLPYEIKHTIIHDFFIERSCSLPLMLLIIGCGLYIFYQVRIIFEGLFIRKSSRMQSGALLIIILEIFNILSVVPVIIWILIGYEKLCLVTGVMASAGMIFVFLTSNRYPRIFRSWQKELNRHKYERSLLNGINTEAVQERLIFLMDEEKVFLNSSLDLRSLAGMMSLTGNQLSQFLNDRMKTNFNDFINSYRIMEAKCLLSMDSAYSILTICFMSGFNSKSSFNAIFKKMTGLTPSQYRDSVKMR